MCFYSAFVVLSLHFYIQNEYLKYKPALSIEDCFKFEHLKRVRGNIYIYIYRIINLYKIETHIQTGKEENIKRMNTKKIIFAHVSMKKRRRGENIYLCFFFFWQLACHSEKKKKKYIYIYIW